MIATHRIETQALVDTEIRAAVDRFMTIFERGDAQAIVDTYSRDPIVGAPSGSLVRGREQLLAFWQGVLGGPGMTVVPYEVVDVQALGEGFAAETTVFEAVIGGQRLHGKYLVVWKREDGQWKLHIDVFNAEPAAQ